MTNQFDPTAWNTGADLLDAAREAWETSSFQAAQSQPVSGNGSVPVDALLSKKTAELKLKWYDLIGEVGVAMGSDVSKMRATAANYAASEEQAVAANERFWE